jgi:AcrR family transcriptional regulator
MVVVHETASPRIARKREARAEAILDEAMALLEREGIERLTLGRLAEALGYVPAALYRYFPSKDALLAGLQRRAVQTIDAAVQEALATVDERTRGAAPAVVALAPLLRAADVYVALPHTHPQAWFLIALLLGDPRLLLSTEESLRTAPLLGALLGAVRARFVAASDAGVLAPGDATTRTLAFWATLHGALVLAKARRIAPELPRASDVAGNALVAMLIGWGAPEKHALRARELGFRDAHPFTKGNRT